MLHFKTFKYVIPSKCIHFTIINFKYQSNLSFIFESFIMGNGAAAAVKSVPGNIIQVTVAAIIVFIIINPLERGLRSVEQ